MKIEIIEEPEQALVELLNNKIVNFNLENREFNQRKSLAVTVKDEKGVVLAGACGVIFGNWLQVNILWVNQELRGKDYGSKLLKEIEQKAKNQGCKECLLDTLDFQAMPFYKKHGYKIAWTQKNYPLTGCKYFMTKTL